MVPTEKNIRIDYLGTIDAIARVVLLAGKENVITNGQKEQSIYPSSAYLPIINLTYPSYTYTHHGCDSNCLLAFLTHHELIYSSWTYVPIINLFTHHELMYPSSTYLPIMNLSAHLCLTNPQSTTYTTPSMVTLVSAMLVARMSFRTPRAADSKALACSGTGMPEYRGHVTRRWACSANSQHICHVYNSIRASFWHSRHACLA